MSGGERSRSEKALENLLKQKNVSIVELISEPTFRSRLKSSPKILTDFLLQDQTINEICDWLLTEEYCSLPNYKPTAQSIFRIFKDSPESLQISFSQNEKLVYRISDFSKSQKEQNLLNCAFFEQMIEFFSLITRGNFLSKFKRLPFLLAKRIEVISIRHLFYLLAANFTTQFTFSCSVVLFILHNLNERNKEQAMLLFTRLVKNSSSFSAFDHSKVINALLDIAKTNLHEELIFTQAFQIVESIQKNTSNPETVQDILDRFSENFDITSLPINYGTAVAIRLLKTFNPTFVMSMVTNPTHMFMHAGILMSIENVSDDELIPFIEENNIPVKLIWAMNVAKSNGYLTKFAILLNSKRELSKSLQTPEWTKFANEQLQSRIDLLNTPPPSNLPKKKKGKQNAKQPSKSNNSEKSSKNKASTNSNEQENQSISNQKSKTKESQQQKKNSKNRKESQETEKSSKATTSKSTKTEKEKEKKKQNEKEEIEKEEKEKEEEKQQTQPESKDNTKPEESNSDTTISSTDGIPRPLDLNEIKSLNSSANSLLQSPVSSSFDGNKTPIRLSPVAPTSPPRQRRPSPIPLYTQHSTFGVENNPEFQEIKQRLSKCKYLDLQLIAIEIMNKKKINPKNSNENEIKEDEIDKIDDQPDNQEYEIKSDDFEDTDKHDVIETKPRSNSLRLTSISPPSKKRNIKGLKFSPIRAASQPTSMSPPPLRTSSIVHSSKLEGSHTESKSSEKSNSKSDSNSESESNEKSKPKSKHRSNSYSRSETESNDKSKSKQEIDSKSKSESNEKTKSKQDLDSKSYSSSDAEQNEKPKSKSNSKSKNEDSNPDDKSKSKSKLKSNSKENFKTTSKSNSIKKSKSKLKSNSNENLLQNDKSKQKKTKEESKPIQKTKLEEEEVRIEIDSDSEEANNKKNEEEEYIEVVSVSDSTESIPYPIEERKSEEEDFDIVELADDATTIGSDITFSRSIDDLPSNLIEIISPRPISNDDEEEDHIHLNSPCQSSGSDILSSSDLPVSNESDSNSKLIEEILNDEEYYNQLSSSPSLPSLNDSVNKRKSAKRFIELDSPESFYSSDSDEDEKNPVFVSLNGHLNKIGPVETNHIILTQFGPLLKSKECSDEWSSSSGSSDDEYMFQFSPVPQKIQRPKSFEYFGKFSSISNEKYGQFVNVPPKENQNKTNQMKRLLPQLL